MNDMHFQAQVNAARGKDYMGFKLYSPFEGSMVNVYSKRPDKGAGYYLFGVFTNEFSAKKNIDIFANSSYSWKTCICKKSPEDMSVFDFMYAPGEIYRYLVKEGKYYVQPVENVSFFEKCNEKEFNKYFNQCQ